MNSRILVLSCLLLGLAACAGGDRVVLMPDADGHVGRIEVKSGGGAQLLSAAKTASVVRDAASAPSAPTLVDDRDIAETWGRLLPPRRHLPKPSCSISAPARPNCGTISWARSLASPPCFKSARIPT